jgi:hypothetical protein
MKYFASALRLSENIELKKSLTFHPERSRNLIWVLKKPDRCPANKP